MQLRETHTRMGRDTHMTHMHEERGTRAWGHTRSQHAFSLGFSSGSVQGARHSQQQIPQAPSADAAQSRFSNAAELYPRSEPFLLHLLLLPLPLWSEGVAAAALLLCSVRFGSIWRFGFSLGLAQGKRHLKQSEGVAARPYACCAQCVSEVSGRPTSGQDVRRAVKGLVRV